jgi:glutaredoxin
VPVNTEDAAPAHTDDTVPAHTADAAPPHTADTVLPRGDDTVSPHVDNTVPPHTRDLGPPHSCDAAPMAAGPPVVGTEAASPADGPVDTVVEIYWRPGCSFCTRLYRGLERYRLPIREINIWEDAEGAATVRELADGNEVVPTVVVGPRVLIGPTPDAVLNAVRLVDPVLHEQATRRARGPLFGLFGR